MADEGTDIINEEQLSFCVRTVCDNLNIDEDFLSFCGTDNTKSKTVFNTTKDILLRCFLSLDDCRGQTYHGASNMTDKHTGVLPKISSEQPKVITTHYQGHSMSLAVKFLTKDCEILLDIMGTLVRLCVLVKHSPKRKKCFVK